MQIDRIGATSFQSQTTPATAHFDDDPRVALDWAPPPAMPVQTQAVAAPARSDNVVNLDAARTHLALSADVYNDTPSPPDGWRVAGPDDLDRLRLTPDLLERADSEFRARVYVSDEGGQTRYVVAFRGSQAGEDWVNNGQQALGLSSEHYDKALRIVLCGHAGEHDELLAHGWHLRTWTARKGYALTDEAVENSASETLWCSPHCVPVSPVRDLFSE